MAGVGESAFYVRGRGSESEFQLACTAIRNAAEDAGLSLEEVDGFISYSDDRNDPLRLAAALGIRALDFSGQTWGGGGNGVASAVMIADAALCAGYAKHVVVFRAIAQGQFRRFGAHTRMGRAAGNAAYTLPYGLLTAAQICALQTMRFMHEHGVEQDALAEVALAAYAHAQHNPRALRRGKPLSREDYHASRWIAEPFHLYDCCPENDGAAAVLMTTMERARDLRKPPVALLAASQGLEQGGSLGAFNERGFPTAHYRRVAETLWERAGVGASDVDVAQFYENFTGPVLMAIAEMGFCEPGEVGAFVADGRIQGPGGALPINTSGGNLGEAYIHGMENINEAVRQVRGESTCQVPGAELSLSVSGPGFAPGSAALFCPA